MLLLSFLVFLSSDLSALASPLDYSRFSSKRSFSAGPVLQDNFPDPAFIHVGNTYYAFATNGGGKNVPLATSNDFASWTLTDQDALPAAGQWSTGADVWAPAVAQLDDGSFVMYYAATSAENNAHHCIGTATASSVDGPYTPQNDAFVCALDQGGAIDPAPFQDADGTRYVVYKIDGNSLGHGGSCNNGVDPIVATPIMLQQVGSDGITKNGDPTTILVNGQYDGPLVEAPSLTRIADSSSAGGWLYFLFFSSGCYSESTYDVSYAWSSNGVQNGGQLYTKSGAPLMVTGADNGNLYAPGGLGASGDIGADNNVLFHADVGQSSDTRQPWAGKVNVNVGARTISI